RAEWRRVVPELLRIGLVGSLDRAAITGYCASWARWLDAERNLSRYGAVIRTPNGFAQLSPYVTIAAAALKSMRAFAQELGPTPASRVRVEPGELLPPPSPPSADSRSPSRFFRDPK